MSNFEDRLLNELRGRVVTPPVDRGQRLPLWRRPRLALAGGLAAMAAVAAIAGVFFFSAGTTAAYAVTKNADGSVTVQIDSLTDAAGLQAQLQAAGVSAVVVYLPAGKVCQRPWFTPADLGDTGPPTTGFQGTGSGGVSFTITPDIPAGDTYVISTQTGAGGLGGPRHHRRPGRRGGLPARRCPAAPGEHSPRRHRQRRVAGPVGHRLEPRAQCPRLDACVVTSGNGDGYRV